MNIVKTILYLFVLLIAGVLMSLAHPFRYEDIIITPSWLTFLGTSVGLLLFIPISLRPDSARKRFLFGFVGGLSLFLVNIYWITYALTHFGNIHIVVASMVMSVLAVYCALFPATWSLIAGSELVKNRSPFLKIICWASAWASLEALRQWLFTGFNWGELGYSFYFTPFIARTTSVWGAHGLTFFWILFIGVLLHAKTFLEDRDQLKALGIFSGVSVVIGAAALFLYPSPKMNSVKVAIVQPNISQEMKWDPGQAQSHLEVLLKLTEYATQENAQVIIWPETSLPYSLSAGQRQLPFTSKIPIVFGAVVRDGILNRNSAVLMKENEIIQRFDKIHLVPFGEYVPYKNLLPLGKLVQNAGDFLPGSVDQELLEIPETKLKMGPLICYEDAFSRRSVAHARKGANLLVNITNDAWYGPTSNQLQHAAMASMQVFQTGLPMVRSTNNGLSTFITPYDRYDQKPFVSGTFLHNLPIPENPEQTFFVWTYPLMEWIFVILFVIALVWKSPRQKKRIFFRKSKHF
ncbi:MAG: Apolipoprotein N-acyltransferase [Bacteriovoracaceae bacterium]|nr:Apolipoprotein N-acyltransferase [Bacteriovoracaceae bacterium]